MLQYIAMNNIALEIRSLIIAEAAGCITAEEQALLDQIRVEFAEAGELSDYIYKVLERTEVNEDKIEAKVAFIIQEGNKIRRRQNTVRTLLISSVAAAVIAVVLFIAAGRDAFKLSGSHSDNQLAALSSTHVLLSVNDRTYELKGKQINIRPDGTISTDDAGNIVSAGLEADQYVSVKIPAAKTYALTLSDGTRIDINAETQVDFPTIFGNSREIFIQGEAYVQTGHDPMKPFFVKTLKNRIQALGTSFNVKANKQDELELALISGRAMIFNGDQKVLVDSGRIAVYNGKDFSLSGFHTDDVLGWLKGIVYLENANENDIITAVAKYLGERITFDRPFNGMQADIPLDRRQPIDSFFNVLPGGYQHEKINGVYHLK